MLMLKSGSEIETHRQRDDLINNSTDQIVCVRNTKTAYQIESSLECVSVCVCGGGGDFWSDHMLSRLRPD